MGFGTACKALRHQLAAPNKLRSCITDPVFWCFVEFRLKHPLEIPQWLNEWSAAPRSAVDLTQSPSESPTRAHAVVKSLGLPSMIRDSDGGLLIGPFDRAD